MKVIDKVRKLIALAGNNPAREEAQSAMLRAQDLLAEHGLSMADIKEEPERLSETTMMRGRTKDPKWWQQAICDVVASNFRCQAILARDERGVSLILIGLLTDLEVAREVCILALRTSAQEASRFLVSERPFRPYWNRKIAGKLRNDFMRGWIHGVNEAFRRHVASSGTELILRRPTLLEEFLKDERVVDSDKDDPDSCGSRKAMFLGSIAGSRFSYRKQVEEEVSEDEKPQYAANPKQVFGRDELQKMLDRVREFYPEATRLQLLFFDGAEAKAGQMLIDADHPTEKALNTPVQQRVPV